MKAINPVAKGILNRAIADLEECGVPIEDGVGVLYSAVASMMQANGIESQQVMFSSGETMTITIDQPSPDVVH